jgi:chromosome segregation ATPase
MSSMPAFRTAFPIKSTLLTVSALFLAGPSCGCQQLVDLEQQQVTLQQTMERNAEQTAALVEQNEAFQRTITEAVLTICNEQLAFKKSLQEGQTERQKTVEDLLTEQETRDDAIGQVIEDLSTRLNESVARLQDLTESLAMLAESQEKGQQEVTVGMVLLNDTQKAFQDSLSQLEQGHAEVLQKLTDLQRGYTQSQERLVRLEQELETLKRGMSQSPTSIPNNP